MGTATPAGSRTRAGLLAAGLLDLLSGPAARPAAGQPAAESIAPPPAAVAADLATPAEQLGYALGYRIGQRIIADHRALGTPLDPAALGQGLADAVRNAPPQLDEAGFRRVLAEFEKRMEARDREIAARMAEAARKNLTAGREFLEANAKREGVTTLPSGLQYEVLFEGAGQRPGLDDVIQAHYRGTHVDGTEFDGTDPAGEPASFPIRGVVPGWQEALTRMPAGSKWRVWLPPELGYGEEGSPPEIEPNEVLIFEIELVGVRPRETGRP
jgi:FKBP-type peptidyl-prolyl cis-trans isomerase FklB